MVHGYFHLNSVGPLPLTWAWFVQPPLLLRNPTAEAKTSPNKGKKNALGLRVFRAEGFGVQG